MNIWLAIAIVIAILWALGFFALPGNRLIDTYTARDCSNLSARLAVYRQKAVEIIHNLLFLSFRPN
jgi:hypothetical protein